MGKKLLQEIVGDKERDEADTGKVTVDVPKSGSVDVKVTVTKDPKKKEESKQGRKQLLG